MCVWSWVLPCLCGLGLFCVHNVDAFVVVCCPICISNFCNFVFFFFVWRSHYLYSGLTPGPFPISLRTVWGPREQMGPRYVQGKCRPHCRIATANVLLCALFCVYCLYCVRGSFLL